MSARLDEIASFLRGEDNTITLVRYHAVLNFGTSSKTGIASNIQLERNHKNEPKQYFYCINYFILLKCRENCTLFRYVKHKMNPNGQPITHFFFIDTYSANFSENSRRTLSRTTPPSYRNIFLNQSTFLEMSKKQYY